MIIYKLIVIVLLLVILQNNKMHRTCIEIIETQQILDTVSCSVMMSVVFIVIVYLLLQLRGYATAFAGCRT